MDVLVGRHHADAAERVGVTVEARPGCPEDGGPE
jgi:hypothetical protein